MKIIKEGSLNLLLGIKRFECRNCGCIFEAEEGEYKHGQQYNEDYYYCDCPYCGDVTSKTIAIR